MSQPQSMEWGRWALPALSSHRQSPTPRSVYTTEFISHIASFETLGTREFCRVEKMATFGQ